MEGITCAKCGEPAMDNGSGLCEPHFAARRDAIKADLVARTGSSSAHSRRTVAPSRAGALTAGRVVKLTAATVICAPIGFLALMFLVEALGFIDLGAEPPQTLGDARVAVREMLRDPSSAEFSDEFIGRNGIACGRVNARNGFGGLAGPQRYIVLPGSSPVLENISGLIDFEAEWQQNCR